MNVESAKKVLAISKKIETEFSVPQTKAALITMLLFTFDNDEIAAIQYLDKIKKTWR